MCLDDFIIPVNDILLFHEKMDATAQIDGLIQMKCKKIKSFLDLRKFFVALNQF